MVTIVPAPSCFPIAIYEDDTVEGPEQFRVTGEADDLIAIFTTVTILDSGNVCSTRETVLEGQLVYSTALWRGPYT